MYVECSGIPGKAGNIQSGIAVANPYSSSVSVMFDVTDHRVHSVQRGKGPIIIGIPSIFRSKRSDTEPHDTLAQARHMRLAKRMRILAPTRGFARIRVTSTRNTLYEPQ